MEKMNSIKNRIIELKGKEIVVVCKEYRGKSNSFGAVIQDIYPAFFTVSVPEKPNSQRISYNYSDILTKDIQINIKTE